MQEMVAGVWVAVVVVVDVDGQTDTDHGQEIQDGRRGSRKGVKKNVSWVRVFVFDAKYSRQ